METFVGDIVILKFRTCADLSDLDLYIKYKRPDGSSGYWTAIIDPTDDTIAKYITTDYDLDIAGKWKFQVFAESASFNSHGLVATLSVLEQLMRINTMKTLEAIYDILT